MAPRSAPDPIEHVLDLELELVRDAIDLVAGGGAPRVTIANLRFGDQLLDQASSMARGAGVRIVPLWTADESGAAIMVERDD